PSTRSRGSRRRSRAAPTIAPPRRRRYLHRSCRMPGPGPPAPPRSISRRPVAPLALGPLQSAVYSCETRSFRLVLASPPCYLLDTQYARLPVARRRRGWPRDLDPDAEGLADRADRDAAPRRDERHHLVHHWLQVL